MLEDSIIEVFVWNQDQSGVSYTHDIKSPYLWAFHWVQWHSWRYVFPHERPLLTVDHPAGRHQRPGTRHGPGTRAASDRPTGWYPSNTEKQWRRSQLYSNFTFHEMKLEAKIIIWCISVLTLFRINNVNTERVCTKEKLLHCICNGVTSF